MLLYGNLSKDNRILFVGTPQLLRHLKSSEIWAGDGTFKVVPTIVEQLFTIHAVSHNLNIPCVFALLANKKRTTYIEVWTAFKQLLDAYPDISDMNRNYLTDFEPGCYLAGNIVFPLAFNVWACFFHFCQRIFSYIQDANLVRHYWDDKLFRNLFFKFTSLAFLPPSKIKNVLGQLSIEIKIDRDFYPIVEKFERVWIGTPGKSPNFAPKLWSVYLRFNFKTNNACEGWHHFFSKSLVVGVHPQLCKLIESIKLSFNVSYCDLAQEKSGKIALKQKSVRDANSKFERLEKEYIEDTYTDLEYVIKIASFRASLKAKIAATTTTITATTVILSPPTPPTTTKANTHKIAITTTTITTITTTVLILPPTPRGERI